ncbi:hypothetical protein OIM69_25790, partial [Escherichia coli]|nr:hypothetical protein [Escherichia coli]
FFSLWHLCCSEVSISPLFRWPNSVNHFRMTKTFGSTIADVIGKNHEAAGDRQGQPAKERIMDLKNNTVGIACGDFSAKCSDACIEKYNTGQLFGLDGIKADNPIKAKQGSSDASNY